MSADLLRVILRMILEMMIKMMMMVLILTMIPMMTMITLQCITLEGWTDMLYWVHDAQGNLGMASEFFVLVDKRS